MNVLGRSCLVIDFRSVLGLHMLPDHPQWLLALMLSVSGLDHRDEHRSSKSRSIIERSHDGAGEHCSSEISIDSQSAWELMPLWRPLQVIHIIFISDPSCPVAIVVLDETTLIEIEMLFASHFSSVHVYTLKSLLSGLSQTPLEVNFKQIIQNSWSQRGQTMIKKKHLYTVYVLLVLLSITL